MHLWKSPTTEKGKKEASEDFLASLVKVGQIKNYVPEYDNQAIHFAGEDLGKDKSIMLVLLYILIVILAFVFMVTIHHTIVKEAGVIGTLRASGYKKSELFLHYMASPMQVTLCAAIVGNVLGYTVFKNIAASLYYGSYSLPTYHTVWNLEAFLLTTVVPLVIMLGVNMISLLHSLKLSPLQFLRRDFKKNKGKKFAVVLFSLLIYLLTKLILERNTNSISLVKIIGYDNLEIGKLYLVATTWVVIASILVSLFLSTFVMKWIYAFMMKEFNGWLTFYIKPTIYIEMFVISIMAYAAVALMQLRKIKRIPMQEVLKNVE